MVDPMEKQEGRTVDCSKIIPQVVKEGNATDIEIDKANANLDYLLSIFFWNVTDLPLYRNYGCDAKVYP